jgi:outer membrane protein assembly factor BamB
MRARLFAALTAGLIVAPFAAADDWPHWMGPKRDNVWYETGILDKFPKDGPKKVWSFPLSGGYAGPAVVNGKVIVTDYVTKDKVPEGNWEFKEQTGVERVWCVDAKTGKEVWKHEYPVTYKISYSAGPRCTPIFDGDKVYTLGAMGDLYCLTAKDGKEVWKKQLKDVYQAKVAAWGYAAHPLIDGDNIITIGGGEGSHIVALNKTTGAEVWKSQSPPEDGFGYVPPSIVEAGGVRQLITATPRAIRALDPATGKRLWTQEYGATSGSVIMTPVKFGDYLYFGGYQNKNILLKLAKDKPDATTEWRDKKGHGVAAVNVQPFLHDGVVYGFDDSGAFYAVELPSGKRLWEDNRVVGYPDPKDDTKTVALGSSTAFIVKNGDRFFFFTEKGDLVIGTLSKDGYKEIDRAKGLLEATDTCFGRKVVWCQPAFADKKMFVRNGKEMICVDLAK